MGKRGKIAVNKLPIATSDSPSMPNKAPEEDMSLKARYALEDIEKAQKHMNDGELMKHVKSAAKEKMETLKKVCK